ncbi:spore germination protein, partial [Bacillus sp. JJ664]
NVFSMREENGIKPTILETSDVHSIKECIQFILNGYVISIDGNKQKVTAYLTVHKTDRSVQESANERIIMGAHDSYVESLETNTTLIRKRIRSKDLVIKNIKLGKRYPVSLSIFYLKDKTPPSMISALEQKLNKFTLEEKVESVQIQAMLEEHPASFFPQVMCTERPDLTVQHLLKGKPAILLDNDPNALLFPYNMYGFFQSPEDFNFRWLIGAFYFSLRFLAFWISVLLPALYIAVSSFHSNILPIGLFYTLKLSTENIPLPPLIEALTMQLFLELLREAALRLPQAIASTIGTVGAIVIGTAIVQTNLISNTMVVVIAATAVASFAIPSKDMSISARLIGLPLLLFASLFGFLGIALGMFLIVGHLSQIQLFGKRYLENPGFSEFAFIRKRKGKKHDFK